MYKPITEVKIGDTIFYDGEQLKVTVSKHHLARPSTYILEFEDKGGVDQYLGIMVRATTEIQVLEPHLIS